MKKSVAALEAYQAEKPVETIKAEYGLDSLARLSANESVYGPSPKVKEAIQAALATDLGYYPDGQATSLRQAVAELDQVAEDNLVFGVGADEIIQLLTRVVLESGQNIVIPDPTFGEYAIHAQIEQAETKRVAVFPETGGVDFEALAAAVDDQTAMVWLANPNNPTGVFESPTDIQVFLDQLDPSVVLVVDEAYIDFVDQADKTVAPLVADYSNLVVLRTLSKAYGLANLRIGYGIIADPLWTAMQAVRLPYNLSTLQIAGGTAAVLDQDYVQGNIEKIRVERAKFEAFLAANEIPFYPSQANFVWVKVGDAPQVGQDLLEAGFQINKRLNPEWVRITLGRPEENERLQEALLQALRLGDSK
ncbi:histidinol-phosphate transaminase [Fructobacillus ficulneus]|uniref:Histidinol-phosphate aminotransferase n=1 Tax=Fructobacillus ficulneus TaxID=157463 RepID=A0A0K8MGH7_9LACO|nr:histidinol-phosphate transaminase [Fructobacillus ficulneus]GAO99640.1 histidinol phosphate aminotransferase [Fructobacillus ficulneus]